MLLKLKAGTLKYVSIKTISNKNHQRKKRGVSNKNAE